MASDMDQQSLVVDQKKDNLISFCGEHSCNKIDLIAGGRFPEVVYEHFFGGHLLDNSDNIIAKNMFDISWTKGPSMPTCVQEAVVGIINNHLIYGLGYCAGLANNSNVKQNKAYRGFNQNFYGFDLTKKKWERIPIFPAQGRQGSRSVIINDTLYVWGGWTYENMSAKQINNIPQSEWPPKSGCQTFSDGYKLSCQINQQNGQNVWLWEKLPSLPFPRTNFGICSHNGLIYICTGGHVLSGQMESSPEFNYLYRLDPTNLSLGWVKLAPIPGTTRTNCTMAAVDGTIYLLGGMAPSNQWKYSSTHVSRCFGILDQWKYDIESGTWGSTIDNVTLNGNWGGYDQVVYKNRYIIMGGGAFFPEIKRNEVVVERLIKPCMHELSHCGCGNTFLDRIYAYDTLTEKFIKCKSKLPGLINLPMIRVLNDQVMFIGGETYSFKWETELFPRPHIDIFAIGKLDFSDF